MLSLHCLAAINVRFILEVGRVIIAQTFLPTQRKGRHKLYLLSRKRPYSRRMVKATGVRINVFDN